MTPRTHLINRMIEEAEKFRKNEREKAKKRYEELVEKKVNSVDKNLARRTKSLEARFRKLYSDLFKLERDAELKGLSVSGGFIIRETPRFSIKIHNKSFWDVRKELAKEFPHLGILTDYRFVNSSLFTYDDVQRPGSRSVYNLGVNDGITKILLPKVDSIMFSSHKEYAKILADFTAELKKLEKK